MSGKSKKADVKSNTQSQSTSPSKSKYESPNQQKNALEVTKFQELFEKADKKKQGKIMLNEFKDLMKANYPEVDQNVINEINEALDQDGNLTHKAYINFMKINLLVLDEEDVISAFKVFDSGNYGYLSCAEFKHILTSLGDKFTEEEVEEVFREANLKSDGKLNYGQFVDFWTKKV